MSKDSSAIIDTGCPRNVLSIDYAVPICNALGMPSSRELVHCDPFYSGYGIKCSEAQLTIGIWNHSLVELYGTHFKLMDAFSFVTISRLNARYETAGTSPSFLKVPREYLREKIIMPTYLSDYHRSHPLAFPVQYKCITSYFAPNCALYSTTAKNFDLSKFKAFIADGSRLIFIQQNI